MNWLADLFFSDGVAYDTSGKPVRRKRLDKFRHVLKIRRARVKSTWKKLPRRFKRIALIAGAALLLTGAAILVWRACGQTNRPQNNTLGTLYPAPSAPTLPVFENESITTDASVPARHWKYIVVHHSGGLSGSAQSFDTYHREIKGWHSLGYHFVIGNGKGQGDGKVAAGPRWYAQQIGAHAHSAEHNEFGIGICLVGSFDIQNPTPAQWRALVDLVRRLSAQFAIAPVNIVGHNQIRQGGSTACPGKNLNIQALREAVMDESK